MVSSLTPENKVIATTIAIFSFLGISYDFYRKTSPSAALPPGPPSLPIIGNAFRMPKELPWLKYAEWAKQYGDIMHVRVYSQPIVILNNYEDADKFMSQAKCSNRRQAVMLNDLMGFDWGLTPMPYGPEWRLCRKLLREQFNQRDVKQYAAQLEAGTEVILRKLLDVPGDFIIHVRWWASRLAVDIGYGIDIGDDDTYVTLAKQVSEYFAIGVEPLRWLVDSFPFLKYIPDWMPGTHFKQVAKQSRAVCKKFIDEPFEEIEKQVAAGTARRSFVSSLITELDKSDPTYKQTENAIKGTAAVFYAAGAETTSATVEAAILYMVLFPGAAKKAQAELDAVIGKKRLPMLGDRPDLPYVTAFWMEVMRYSSPVPLGIPHQLTETDYYGGYILPKDSLIIPNIWAMLRDPRVYVDPELFNPDRFLATKEHVPEMDPGTVGVFGFGRRVCPGRYLAEMSTWLFVASILSAFDISPALDDSGKPIDVRYALKGITNITTRPCPFTCSIKARSRT